MPFYLLPTLSTRDDDDGNFCSILRIVYYHQRWIFKLDFLVVACRDSRTKWNRNVRQQLWQRALILRSDSKLSYRGVSIRPVREIDAVFFCSLISSQSAALSWLLISISKKSEDALCRQSLLLFNLRFRHEMFIFLLQLHAQRALKMKIRKLRLAKQKRHSQGERLCSELLSISFAFFLF